MSQRSQGRDRGRDATASAVLLGMMMMMLAMVVVVAVQGQRTRLVAEPIWLDDRLGSYNALVNSGL